jgi:hypothetical protein
MVGKRISMSVCPVLSKIMSLSIIHEIAVVIELSAGQSGISRRFNLRIHQRSPGVQFVEHCRFEWRVHCYYCNCLFE